MCYTERGFFLVVLNFKSMLPSKTFLYTAFLGNYYYSNEWSQAAWAFKVLPFIFPFNLLTSYHGLCWLPVKRGLPKRRVRGSFTDQNVLLSEGWGLFLALWNSCPTLTCPLLQASVCQSNTTTHTVIAVLFGRTRNVLVTQSSAQLALQTPFPKCCKRSNPACEGEVRSSQTFSHMITSEIYL